MDWAPMERLLAPLRAPRGQPGYPPLALFRALLLAQWYQLSDPGLEEALADRLSFRRFCGLGLDDDTPDETTICRFRAALAEHRLTSVKVVENAAGLEVATAQEALGGSCRVSVVGGGLSISPVASTPM
jgi:hypothetical protein